MDLPAELASLILRGADARASGQACIRLATVPREGKQWLVSVRFEFNQAASGVRAQRLVYPNLTLAKCVLARKAGVHLLNELLLHCDISLPGLGPIVAPQLTGLTHRLRSGEDLGLVKSDWPTVYLDCSGGQPPDIEQLLQSTARLSARKLPLYPSIRAAVRSFVHGRHGAHDTSQSSPTLLAVA